MQYIARKQGNSVGITIPISISKLLGIKVGDKLNIELCGKKLVIQKKQEK